MRILVVDDHSYNRDLLRFVIEDEGHDCLEAENGIQAIEAFEKNEDVDLILMDVNMPEMDGISATKKICEIKGERFVTIIFVTALDNPDVLVECLDAGGDDFVPKPINERVLLSKVNAHVRNQDNYNKLRVAHQELKYHQQSIEREHAIVEHVFANGLDRSSTRCDNVVAYTSSMSMFNGDVVLVAPSPSGGVYVLIGDFTGHGLSAAIGSLPVMSVFYSFVAKQSSISEIVVEINSHLHRLLPMGMFFCAALMHLDAAGQRLSMWSGGMNDALLIDPDGQSMGEIPGDHMPLGILSPEEFDDSIQLHELQEGGRLYVYTDGVNEAKDQEGNELGDERVKELLLSYPSDRIAKLTEAVRDFQGGDNQKDDISIVELASGPCVHRDKYSNQVVDVAADYHGAHCFPWQLAMKLQGEDLQRTDIIHQVALFLGSIQGVELHQDKLFTILSELFNNALEHGVLGLSSTLKASPDGFEEYYRLREERLANLGDGFIEIQLAYIRGNPNCIRLVITDSGEGFDFAEKQLELERNDECHGRGMQLLHMLCADLKYSNQGRTVTAIYNFE